MSKITNDGLTRSGTGYFVADDDDDELKSYVSPLLQLETVTSVPVLRSDKQFSFQITMECGYKIAAAYWCWKRIPGGWSCHGEAARTVSERPQ